MYNKSQMHLDAWHKSIEFAIMISISINTRGFGAFLTKYTYNKIYLHLLHILYNGIYRYIIYIYIHIFLKGWILLMTTKFWKPIGSSKLIRHSRYDFFAPFNSTGRGVLPPPSTGRVQLLYQFFSKLCEDRPNNSATD